MASRIFQIVVSAFFAASLLLAQAPGPAKPKGKPSESTTAVIDINTATAEQLQSVPGIGDVYARKIIAGRPYKAKNELIQKKILPAGVYDKIKERIVAHRKG